MGRVRGKRKKQTVVTAHKDVGGGKEDKMPESKRRGRPQKPLKDDFEDEEIEKITNGDENGKSNMINKSSKGGIVVENGTNKRKRSSQVKDNSDSINEENGLETKSIAKDSVQSVGFRQNGSRRKSKPRRAAEVGVECK